MILLRPDPRHEVGNRSNEVPPERMTNRKTNPTTNQPKDKFKRNREIMK